VGFETREGLSFFFKNIETKYHNVFPHFFAFFSLVPLFSMLKERF
jgi:hypothetical protein